MELELGKDLGLRYSPLEYELSFWVKTPESLKLGTCSLIGHFECKLQLPRGGPLSNRTLIKRDRIVQSLQIFGFLFLSVSHYIIPKNNSVGAIIIFFFYK